MIIRSAKTKSKIDVKGLCVGCLHILMFFIIACGLLSPGYHAAMYYDSSVWIDQQRQIFARGNLGEILGLFSQRPLSIFSFYLNFLIGDLDPVIFRLINTLGLAILGYLLILVVQKSMSAILPESNQSDMKLTKIVSTAAGLIFVLHPLNIYITLYIWQRSVLLAAIFYLAALNQFLYIRNGNRSGDYWSWCWYLVFFAAAITAKEIAITLPLIVLVAEFTILKSSGKDLIKKAPLYLLPAILAAGLLSFSERAHGKIEYEAGIWNTLIQYHNESGLSLLNIIFTQTRVVFIYLSDILFPTVSGIQLIKPIEISEGMISPWTTLPAIILLFGTIVLGLILVRKRPLAAFGIFFFLICLIPEAILVPQYQYFGYRPILPMVGVILTLIDGFLVFFAYKSDKHGVRYGMIVSGVFVCLALWFGYVTHTKAQQWGNPVEFWGQTVAQFPVADKVDKAAARQAYHNLGISLQFVGRHTEAVNHLEKALTINPNDLNTVSALASAYSHTGKYEPAINMLNSLIDRDPYHSRARRNLSDILIKQGHFEKAERVILDGLKRNPNDEVLLDALGVIQHEREDYDSAKVNFMKAIQINPRMYVAYSNLGAVLLAENNIDEAERALDKALKIRPDYGRALINLGVAQALRGNTEEALKFFKKALDLNPENEIARDNYDAALREVAEKNLPQSK